MPSTVTIDLVIPGVALGWVVAEGCVVGPSSGELLAEVRAATARAVASQDWPAPRRRRVANRDLLRFGAYKPTGRGKPASEYLVNAAAEEEFPPDQRPRGHQQPRLRRHPAAHLPGGPGPGGHRLVPVPAGP